MTFKVLKQLNPIGAMKWMIISTIYNFYSKTDKNQIHLLPISYSTLIVPHHVQKYVKDRECNCSLPSKVNRKCVYEGKCWFKCIIYKLKCFTCDAIYIGNTQHTFKKRMDGHFSDLQRLLENRQKSDSFVAHFVQHFNSTTSHTELRKYMTFKVIKQLNQIGAMKTFTKPNCSLCMQERLTILKMIRDKVSQ